MANTVANVRQAEASHWYTLNGEPCYEVPKKDGTGMTSTTLAHARKMNLLPSVTTILSILDKPALTSWKIEQAVLAVLTTPRLPGEADDAFTTRVLTTTAEQDKERNAAAQLGTDIHAAIEGAINGFPVEERLQVYVAPVIKYLWELGTPVWSEKILVGKGYAGRCDLCLTDNKLGDAIVDFKSAKRLPKESYPEQKLQLAAYAKASGRKIRRLINVYISTTNPGDIFVSVTPNTKELYQTFNHLLETWSWLKQYRPVICKP